MTDPIIKKQLIKANGLEFTCRVSGKPENTPVILLHGWPETSHMWEELMTHLALEDYYCIAPNMRGYSIGAKPKGKANYALELLIKDVASIANTLGITKFHLIGHDWGACIGWKMVESYPDLIQSWTALSVPHIQAFGTAIVSDPKQGKMSAYMKGFQLPYLPELRLKQKNYKVLRTLWKNSSNEQLDDYLEVFSQKGVLRASINYYRKNYRLLTKALKQEILGAISHPTLFIWGAKDLAIGRKAVELQDQYMKGPYELIILEDAGHWLMQTRFTEIKNAILKHITAFPIE